MSTVPGSTAWNSSPPRRPTWPWLPITDFSRSATWRSSASPIGWPSVSLTFLNRSRSIRNSAQPFCRWAALRSASSSVWRIIARLGRPVSELKRARREISCSERRCSVRSVPMPRKPRKRPRSSKIGLPDSDQWTSCVARRADDHVGEREAGGQMEAERLALLRRRRRAGVDRQQVGELAAEQRLGLALEIVGELLRDIGQGAERVGFPEPAAARCFRTRRRS